MCPAFDARPCPLAQMGSASDIQTTARIAAGSGRKADRCSNKRSARPGEPDAPVGATAGRNGGSHHRPPGPPRLHPGRQGSFPPGRACVRAQHRAFLLIGTMNGEHGLGRAACLDVSIARRLNFVRTVLGWCVTTQLWHEMPWGPSTLAGGVSLPYRAAHCRRGGATPHTHQDSASWPACFGHSRTGGCTTPAAAPPAGARVTQDTPGPRPKGAAHT
jgi:hypothetical protein